MEHRVAFFIPARFLNDVPQIFMQVRSQDDPDLGGYHAFFGGGVDQGETFEQGFLREIKEELDYRPSEYKWLQDQQVKHEGVSYAKRVYWELVPDNFDNIIKIGEGDGGIWVNEEEIPNLGKVFEADAENIKKLFALLKQK